MSRTPGLTVRAADGRVASLTAVGSGHAAGPDSCALRGLGADSRLVSATSPLGRMPSANHTRFCSRGQPDDTGEREREEEAQRGSVGGDKKNRTVCVGLRAVVLSLFGCLRTDTGTMTVGGGELSVPAARACCRGGMVLQYSDGTLGLGLGPAGLIIRSRAWATGRKASWRRAERSTHVTHFELPLAGL